MYLDWKNPLFDKNLWTYIFLKILWRHHICSTGSVDSGTEVPVVIVRERVRTLIMVNDAIQTDEPDQNVATGGISVVAETEC